MYTNNIMILWSTRFSCKKKFPTKLHLSSPRLSSSTVVVQLPSCKYLWRQLWCLLVFPSQRILTIHLSLLSSRSPTLSFPPAAKNFNLAASSSWKLHTFLSLPVEFLKRVYSCIVVESSERRKDVPTVYVRYF